MENEEILLENLSRKLCPGNSFVCAGTITNQTSYRYVPRCCTMERLWTSLWPPRANNCRRIRLSFPLAVPTFRWEIVYLVRITSKFWKSFKKSWNSLVIFQELQWIITFRTIAHWHFVQFPYYFLFPLPHWNSTFQ